jgi:hypothetical protein
MPAETIKTFHMWCFFLSHVHLELGPGPCYLRIGHDRDFGTNGMARYEIFWAALARHEHENRAVPAQHEHENRVVPRILARWATWPDPHFESCLGWHGTKMTRRYIYNSTM